MTLIAGFKCAEGYVICSDSQESFGDRRAPADKLSIWTEGNFEIAFAGSGNNGELIDAFEQRLRDELTHNQGVPSLKELKDLIQVELQQFQQAEAVHYPRKERQMRLVIGARDLSKKSSILWSSKATRLKVIDVYDLAGCEEELYRTSVEAYLKPNPTPTIAQGIFLGLYVVWLGEQTNHFIKSPVHVAIIKDHGIARESQEKVNALFDRVKRFVQQFDMLFLACPDTGLSHSDFAGRLNNFTATVMSMRKDYVEDWVDEAFAGGVDRVNDAYNLIPAGTVMIKPPPTEGEEGRKYREEMNNLSQALRKSSSHMQEPERIIENLNELRSFFERRLAGYLNSGGKPTEEELAVAMRSYNELSTALLMGECKVGGKILSLLDYVVSHVRIQYEFEAPTTTLQMRIATAKMRVGVLEQALAQMESP